MNGAAAIGDERKQVVLILPKDLPWARQTDVSTILTKRGNTQGMLGPPDLASLDRTVPSHLGSRNSSSIHFDRGC